MPSRPGKKCQVDQVDIAKYITWFWCSLSD